MAGIPKPSPCYLDDFEKWKIVDGRQVWRNKEGSRLYTWDSLHGEVEVFDSRGYHLGALHAVSGELIKPAKKRRLDVK
ncbi:MAG TPA: colicin E3/pyocin S6 family cytotoxin [Verrucomicrobiae bacterium]|jgi:hypothetical protein